MLLIIGCDNSCTIRTIIAFIALFICILKLFCCFIFVINYLWILFYNKNHHCLYRLVYLYFKIMLMFYIIELYYIVCFSMTNKSMRTFYVNKNSVCLSVCITTIAHHVGQPIAYNTCEQHLSEMISASHLMLHFFGE